MSDKRDDQGRDDDRRPGPDDTAAYDPVRDDDTAVRGGDDATQRFDRDDATQRYDRGSDQTQRYDRDSDQTQRYGGTAEQPTVRQPPYPDDRTAQIPPGQDGGAWAGRAGVPPPGAPPRGPAPTEWAEPEDPHQRRWWMPILLGVLALLLIGVIAFGLWLLLRDDSGSPEPTPSPTVVPTTAAPTTAAPTTAAPTSAAAVAVPPVIGRSEAEARTLLDAAGLQPELDFVESDQPAGTVVDADPPPGSQVAPNSTVTLFISEGPPPTSAPPSSPPPPTITATP
jgi:hypothetical protein